MNLVRIIKPPNYPHVRCFFDVAKSIELSLPPDWTREIVFGANLCHIGWPHHVIEIPDDAVIMNLEAYCSPWMTGAYIALMRDHQVLDYAESNVDWLRERGVDAHYCPIRYHPHLTRLTLSPEPDLDCLFYGSLGMGRRPEILKAIEATGLTCMWLDHDRWDERDDAICRSKIVLNLHAYPNAPLEMARISYLLANGAFVLSEGLPEAMPIMFSEPKDMAADCVYWASHDQIRRNTREIGARVFSNLSQADALKTALAELQVTA